jgi:hypothetical protein
MTDEKRFQAAAYLQHCAQQRDPAYQAMLAERMKRMDSSRKITLEQARRTHNILEKLL